MTSKRNPVRRAAIYIASGGVILFLAVFVGIQIGYALKSDSKKPSSSPETPISNRPTVGDRVPFLKLFTADGGRTDLRTVVSGNKALIVFTMPGCHSCTDLLSGWQSNGIHETPGSARIIVVAATPPDDFNAGDLAEFESSYTMYFCDDVDLYAGLDMYGVPAVMGASDDGRVSVFTDNHDAIRDKAFLERYM
jgi:hypothetical protein